MNIDLSSRTAVVCGASAGIGKAIAIALAASGARIFAVSRRKPELENLIAKLAAISGLHHVAIEADLAKPTEAANFISEVLSENAAHILINNTGGPPGGLLFKSDSSQLTNTFQQHVVAAHELTQLLLPGMIHAHFGRIINIISTSVRQPIPGLGVSNTVRGAMSSWAKTMSFEVAENGITVNNILPGYTKTDRLAAIIKKRAIDRGVPESQIENEMLAEIPAKRFGVPEDCANLAAFLCSPFASYINGVSIAVDGGRTTAF